VVDLSDGAREHNTETLRADHSGSLIMVLVFSRRKQREPHEGHEGLRRVRMQAAEISERGGAQISPLLAVWTDISH